MKIVGVVFDYAEKSDYARLARVWEESARQTNQHAEIVLHKIEPPQTVKRNTGLSSNNHKFKVWNAEIQAANNGDLIVLTDVDLMILADLRPAFKGDFDIGVTRRTAQSWPINAGVVFVRVSDASKRFIERWGEVDQKMYEDEVFHEPYKRKYKGQNQAALGYLRENNDTGAVVQELPCAVWNACNEDYVHFKLGTTKVVHIKSTLRHAILGKTRGVPSKMKPICKLWKAFESAAKERQS